MSRPGSVAAHAGYAPLGGHLTPDVDVAGCFFRHLRSGEPNTQQRLSPEDNAIETSTSSPGSYGLSRRSGDGARIQRWETAGIGSDARKQARSLIKNRRPPKRQLSPTWPRRTRLWHIADLRCRHLKHLLGPGTCYSSARTSTEILPLCCLWRYERCKQMMGSTLSGTVGPVRSGCPAKFDVVDVG